MHHRTLCIPNPLYWEAGKLKFERDSPPAMQVPSGVANPGDEKLGQGDFFSPLRAGFFDILFVGGHEAVCAVAIEPSPPIPRARMRSFDLSDACAHASAD